MLNVKMNHKKRMDLLFSLLFLSLCFSCFLQPTFARGGQQHTSGFGNSSYNARHLFEKSRPHFSNDFAQDYMTNSDLDKAIKAFAQRCSNISRIYSIGTSVKGVPLWVIEISDKPGEEEAEPAFKYIGNVHGDEPVGRELLLFLANWICDNHLKDPLATLIVENVHLHILPTMNPDGFSLRRRGNANNVDLNRDFPDQASDIWNLVPLCLMWIVWLERNRRSFEDTSTSDSQLRDSFAVMLFDWSRAWGFTSSPNVFDFISCLSHSS